MGRRTKARECAFQMLYQWELTQAPLDQVIEEFWQLRTTPEATKAQAERLTRGTYAWRERIDALIAETATRWRPERIAMVDRSILRLGSYELLAEPGTPASVVIDEGIELAKRFSEAESYAFVNGILDAIRRRQVAEATAASEG